MRSTPSTLRLLLIVLTTACLAWGAAARDAFAIAEIAVAILAIMMAASAAMGLNRRLTEYR